LYAFTFADSLQKDIPVGGFSDYGKEYVDENYQIPTLILENVEFTNFLNDYESLIYVENDNVIK